MKISREFIEQNKTERGGWTNAQCFSLGEPWPPKRGWIDRAVEREFTQEQIDDFVRYRVKGAAKSLRKQLRRERLPIVARVFPPTQPVKPKKPPKAPKIKRPSAPEATNAFLQTYEWRRVRMVALKKYGSRCQCCGSTPENGAVMHVDHIKPRKLYPSLALDVENLQILCHECNHGKGNWDMTDWRAKETT